MALLDMFKDKYDLSVCHVNYHHRQTANRDEKIVRNYCKKYDIPFYLYDYKDEKGNFEDNARVFRYEAFKECINKHQLDGVLVGHHKDDLIETYFLQKARKSNVTYYGLKKETIIKDVKVIRPLLKYTKEDLINYCDNNKIKYGIDETNLSDEYARNRIRHSKVEKMSLIEKNSLVREINELNKAQQVRLKEVKKFINKRNRFPYDELINYVYLKDVLRMLIKNDLSDKHLDEIIKALHSKKNVELLVHNKFIFKEYDYIDIVDKEENYSYTLNSIRCFKTKHFKLCKNGSSKEGVTLSAKDFPITIRNYQNGDAIKMLYGTKKLNRYFIDNKISSKDRKMWPVMIASDKSAILVPGIGCDKYHYSTKHTIYMIKL